MELKGEGKMGKIQKGGKVGWVKLVSEREMMSGIDCRKSK